MAYKVYDANNSYVEVTEGSTNAFGHFTIPGYVTNAGVDYKVKRVGEYAFFYAASAFDVTFEEGVTEIQQFAFSYCDNLTAINLPKSLRTLGQSCFARNNSLPAITFPEGIKPSRSLLAWAAHRSRLSPSPLPSPPSTSRHSPSVP
ncbi:MAG: leucine-rich repeat domain-containing protein, partial [Bacteroidales bacterium]|nr:leucine-rich repeat domain-containing protein [Bacteroidales bacterium]